MNNPIYSVKLKVYQKKKRKKILQVVRSKNLSLRSTSLNQLSGEQRIPSRRNVASLDKIRSSKYRDKAERSAKLSCDNARPQTASTTKDIVMSLICDVLRQSAYSLDIATSHYYMFRSANATHLIPYTRFQLVDQIQGCVA